MNRGEIVDKIVGIIREQKTLPEVSLAGDAALSEAGIDSLDALSILFALEETFNIRISDDQARSIKTLDDMVTIVESLLRPAPGTR